MERKGASPPFLRHRTAIAAPRLGQFNSARSDSQHRIRACNEDVASGDLQPQQAGDTEVSGRSRS